MLVYKEMSCLTFNNKAWTLQKFEKFYGQTELIHLQSFMKPDKFFLNTNELLTEKRNEIHLN